MTSPDDPWSTLTSDPNAEPSLVAWLHWLSETVPRRTRHAIELYGIPPTEAAPELLGSSPDVYRLLRTTTPPADLVGMAVVAMAWIGSIDSPVPPRRQPNRRRCRQITVIDERNSIASLLEIDREAPVVLTGAEGRVPIALRTCWRRRLSAA